VLAQRGVQPIPHGLRRAAGRLGRRFEMVRCEYAAPAFVIAGLDTEKSAHPAWSSPAVTGAGLRSCANKAAMQMPKAHTSCKARLHLFPVLVLFRSVIAGPRGRPDGGRVRPFPVFLPWLTGKSPAPGCIRCPVFLQLFTGIYRQTGVNRTLPLRPETRKRLHRRSLAAPAPGPQAARYSRSSRNGSAS
jgi:hypothetical protein